MSLTTAILVLVAASAVIVAVGPRMVRVADELADATGLGEALMGAILLGAVTSLPDLAATLRPALSGLADQAAGNALGGILAQTAFLAVADLTYRRANLEHATASLPNLVQTSVLVMVLAGVGIAMESPELAVGHVHVATLGLPLLYWYGQRLVSVVEKTPLWEPVETSDSRPDVPDEENEDADVTRLLMAAGVLGVLLAGAGWAAGAAGEVVASETALTGGAVGALLTGSSSSLPELVVSVAAVRRGALVLAVANVIGGNTFDSLLMVVGDAAYLDGSLYAATGEDVEALVAVAIAMTIVMVLGMLRRQRHGMANIGTESVAVLLLYAFAASVVL